MSHERGCGEHGKHRAGGRISGHHGEDPFQEHGKRHGKADKEKSSQKAVGSDEFPEQEEFAGEQPEGRHSQKGQSRKDERPSPEGGKGQKSPDIVDLLGATALGRGSGKKKDARFGQAVERHVQEGRQGMGGASKHEVAGSDYSMGEVRVGKEVFWILSMLLVGLAVIPPTAKLLASEQRSSGRQLRQLVEHQQLAPVSERGWWQGSVQVDAEGLITVPWATEDELRSDAGRRPGLPGVPGPAPGRQATDA